MLIEFEHDKGIHSLKLSMTLSPYENNKLAYAKSNLGEDVVADVLHSYIHEAIDELHDIVRKQKS